jgi:hypothetical protein
LLSVAAVAAAAQDVDPGKYVTREEYEKVLQRLDKVSSELEAVKAKQDAMPKTSAADTDRALDDVEKTVREIQEQVNSTKPGDNRFLLTGFGFVQFEDHRGSTSSFSAGVNPIILWTIGDRLIFETEFEVELRSKEEGGGTEFNLEYADLAYTVNDWLIVGGGKFKTPLGIFNSRLESKWINKLPDRPLPYDDEVGIAPEASVGAFARGAFAIAGQRFNYDLYVANGPTLNTDDPESAGTLDFDNFVDENDNKAVGGRIGWLPIPSLELGYSVQWSKADPHGFDQDVHALIQAVDLSYVRAHRSIGGQIDFRLEWVFSNVDKATFGGGTSGFGPLRFNNDRNAGYAQLAYRPTLADNKILKNLEFVARYDRLNVSAGAPGGGWEQRYEFGIDYWINPSTVVKTAYEVSDSEKNGTGDAFFIQAVMGF